MFNVNFANDWCRKRPLYQMRHNHSPYAWEHSPYLGGSITVRLTACLTGLDLIQQVGKTWANTLNLDKKYRRSAVQNKLELSDYDKLKCWTHICLTLHSCWSKLNQNHESGLQVKLKPTILKSKKHCFLPGPWSFLDREETCQIT